jgi:hypothetical protein
VVTNKFFATFAEAIAGSARVLADSFFAICRNICFHFGDAVWLGAATVRWLGCFFLGIPCSGATGGAKPDLDSALMNLRFSILCVRSCADITASCNISDFFESLFLSGCPLAGSRLPS